MGPSKTTDEVLRGGIRLPCSAASRADRYRSFGKLLRSVPENAATGFDFEGCILRPGAIVAPSALRPTPDYPTTPVLLEYAAAGMGRGTGHNRRAALYVLWRYHSNEWEEIGRAASESWEWALDLGPIARRALEEARGGVVRIMPDLRQISVKISSFLDEELRAVEPGDRQRILSILHDQFACRLSR